MSLALLSGALVLAAGPLSFALLLVLTRAADGEGFATLAETVAEGGLFSYVVLATSGLAGLLSAGLMGLSVRRPSLSSALALSPFLLTSVAAFFGTSNGMGAARAAVIHASPLDRATILAGSISELLSLSSQALAILTAACLALAVAALVALGAPQRGARLVTALGASVLAASLGAALLRVLEVRSAFRAIAHAAPVDRLALVLATARELEPLSRLAAGLFLASLVVAVAGGVVAARSSRLVGLSTAAALVVFGVGARGLLVLGEQALRSDPAPQTPLQTVEGLATSTEALTLPGALDDGALEARWGMTWVAVSLTPSLTRAQLEPLLREAHGRGFSLELVGRAKQPHTAGLAPLLASVAAIVADVQLAVPVRLLFTDEVCEGCVGRATLDGEALVVTRATDTVRWNEVLRVDAPRAPPPTLDFTWTGTPAELALAAQLAASNGHLLAVRVTPAD
ncbi:MAG: hypothetical protein ACOZQL_21250 [Myxococcota bacterium]